MGSPDSISQRSSAAKAGSLDDGEGNDAQKGGKEIADMMGFDKEPPHRGAMDPRPLKMMDIVHQIWGNDFYHDPEEEEDV